MKNFLVPVIFFFIYQSANAADKDSTVYYNLDDSIKAIQFMAEINVQSVTGNKEASAGIRTDAVKLSLETDKKGREIAFEFPASAHIMANGLYTRIEKDEISFDYNWVFNETYKLLIAVATDSANNFSIYSGYIWLTKENKWKLIGTCKIAGRWNTIQEPASFSSSGKKSMQMTIGQVWVQRNNGSWKNMSTRTPSEKDETLSNPTINLFGHFDSVQQHQIDKKIIEDAIASGKTDAKNNLDGVYYTMIKEGTGKQVSLNDTVTVNYRLSLFNDTAVIQQTKDGPATFPLKRLIKGWQIGVPLCKVGGKIKLVIPSDLAYSIRTRAADIPPNSILVFEIEVLDAK